MSGSGGRPELNRRQQAFCLAIAMGAGQTEAAREAGFAHPGVYSNTLMKQPAIRGRIAELRGLVDKEKARHITRIAEPTRAWVIGELCSTVAWAKEAGDRAGTLKGLELVGRELGMFVQRSMMIESPLQRLPADRLLQLLSLVEEAVGIDQQTVAPAKPIAAPDPPLIEAEAEAEAGEPW